MESIVQNVAMVILSVSFVLGAAGITKYIFEKIKLDDEKRKNDE